MLTTDFGQLFAFLRKIQSKNQKLLWATLYNCWFYCKLVTEKNLLRDFAFTIKLQSDERFADYQKLERTERNLCFSLTTTSVQIEKYCLKNL